MTIESRPGVDADEAVRLLLGGHEPGAFVRDHWEATPVLVPAAANPDLTRWLTQSLSLEQIDEMFATRYATGWQPVNSITVVQANAQSPPEEFTRRRRDGFEEYDGHAVLGHHERGASLVLNSAHRRHPQLGAWCHRIARWFGLPVHANVYLTPPESFAFALHADPHDVFIVQIAGTKTWRTAAPEYPVATAVSTGEDLNHTPPDATTTVLTAGDVLYIPRGMLHQATTQTGMSAHLTIGITPYTGAQLLRDVVTAAERDRIELRRSVSIPPRDPDTTPAVSPATLAGLLRAIESWADPASLAAAAGASRDRALATEAPDTAGHLRALHSRWLQ